MQKQDAKKAIRGSMTAIVTVKRDKKYREKHTMRINGPSTLVEAVCESWQGSYGGRLWGNLFLKIYLGWRSLK